MSEKRYKYNVLLVILCVLIFFILILSFIVDTAGIIADLQLAQINNHKRFNVFIQKFVFAALVISLIATLSYLYKQNTSVTKYYHSVSDLLKKLSLLLNLRTLFVIILLYSLVLYILAIKNYDLGVDEVCYIIYAKSFCSYGIPFGTINGNLFHIDHYSYLPEYIFSVFLFLFNGDSVWHFKLFSALLSIISIAVIFCIIKKIYDLNTSILFLFFFTIQPGFGYVSTSFFAEIPQTAFIFLAAYSWLHKSNRATRKTVLLTSVLLAFAIETKIQSIIPLVLSLIIYRFVDKDKKPLTVLFCTLAFVFLISVLRLIPAFFYDSSYVSQIPRLWFLFSQSQGKNDIIVTIERLILFNKFFSLLLFTAIIISFALKPKSAFEKFLCFYTVFVVAWWIFIYHLNNYRLIYMGLIPLLFLLALLIMNLFRENNYSFKKNKPYTVYWLSSGIVLLCLWGFATNIIYANIGYSDGVQFDLDGSKETNFFNPAQDDSQKRFYESVRSFVNTADSVFVASEGIPTFVPQFYLGSNRIFDIRALKSSLAKSNTPKLVIVDRTAYPLSLSGGYQLLDSLCAERKLLIKHGEYELYSIFKNNVFN